MGRRIRYLRQRIGIPATELARRLGVTPSAVGKWEAGRAAPNDPEAVARALGLSPAEFYVASIPEDDASAGAP